MLIFIFTYLPDSERQCRTITGLGREQVQAWVKVRISHFSLISWMLIFVVCLVFVMCKTTLYDKAYIGWCYDMICLALCRITHHLFDKIPQINILSCCSSSLILYYWPITCWLSFTSSVKDVLFNGTWYSYNMINKKSSDFEFTPRDFIALNNKECNLYFPIQVLKCQTRILRKKTNVSHYILSKLWCLV